MKTKTKYGYVGSIAGKCINHVMLLVTCCVLFLSIFITMVLVASDADVYTKSEVDYFNSLVDNDGQIAQICEYYEISTKKKPLTEYELERLNHYKNSYCADKTNLRFVFEDENGNQLFACDDKEFLRIYQQIKKDQMHVSNINNLYYSEKKYYYDQNTILTVWIMNPNFTNVRNGIYWNYYEDTRITYMVKNASLIGLPVGGILSLVFFILVLCGAGRKKGSEEVVLSGIHRIPFDLLFLGNLGILICSFLFAGLVWDGNRVGYMLLFLIGFLALMIVQSTIVTIAARIKAGNLWKNTIIARLIANGRAAGEHKYRFWIVLSIEFLMFLYLIYVLSHSNNGIMLYLFIYIIISLLILKSIADFGRLEKQMHEIISGNLEHNRMEAFMIPWMRDFSDDLANVGEGLQAAVKEQIKSEHLKTELITNVSHDIKTPLTSIINYVDLLKNGTETEEQQAEYLEVLDRQSRKLKKLTEDLVQFSKANTGNMEMHMENMKIAVLIDQACGEYEGKFEEKHLELWVNYHFDPKKEVFLSTDPKGEGLKEENLAAEKENLMVEADGRFVWRIFDNLFGNLYKYAMEGTRVYLDVYEKDAQIEIAIKNISAKPLNITGEELKERFVRGDSSRNTEGSGLGLSIAESFTTMMHGTFDVIVDGDLFKVVFSFQKSPK